MVDFTLIHMGFPGGSDEEFACNTGDLGLIPGSSRSPEEVIPCMTEPGRLQSKGSQRVGHD